MSAFLLRSAVVRLSQKVHISGFKLIGHVYAGVDENELPVFMRDGRSVAQWLGHNTRVRYNQQRSRRSKYVYVDKVRQLDEAGNPLLVPIGDVVTELSTGQARQQLPWMASTPSMVLHHAVRDEQSAWFAAAKRRKTLGSRAGVVGGCHASSPSAAHYPSDASHAMAPKRSSLL